MMRTKDLWFASFLMLKGHEVSDFEPFADGRYFFHFEVSAEDWKKYKLEFHGSDVSRVKYCQERLRDLVN
jgi:hypothetical protein